MADLIQTPSGIIVPHQKPVGVRCGYCPAIIFKQNESRGRLFMLNDKPICARCRILRGKMGGRIRGDAPAFEKDMHAKEAREQEKANAEVAAIAAAQKSLEKKGKGKKFRK